MFNLFKKKPKVEFKKPTLQIAKGREGHKIFELDLSTLEIKETIYKSVVEKPGFWYCAALNVHNASKEFIRMAKILRGKE